MLIWFTLNKAIFKSLRSEKEPTPLKNIRVIRIASILLLSFVKAVHSQHSSGQMERWALRV
jgi:hypothetical protein